MICKNCGFQNAPGDQFCGSCGKFLEWSADSPGSEAAEGQPVSSDLPVPPTSEAVPPTSEAVPPPSTPETPPPATAGSDSPTQPLAVPPTPSFEADIICWNCGRRNPATRTFCQQCGERLSASTLTGAGGGAGGDRRPPVRQDDDGGGRNRALAIGIGLIAVLLLAGGATAMLLGGSPPGASPSPTGTLVAEPVSPEPSESPPFGESPSPSLSRSPSPGEPASPSPGQPASPSPTASPTATVTAAATPTASPTSTPTATPTQAATPTPAPTPAHCDGPINPANSTTLDAANPVRQISANRVWCVTQITFGDGVGDGTLKIFLTNAVFLSPEYGYSSARLGWNEVFMSGGTFAGSSTESPAMLVIHPLLDPDRSHRMFPQGTEIELEISCDTEGCSGSVRIDHERRPAPPLHP